MKVGTTIMKVGTTIMKVGRLRAGTERLNLHADPNGQVVGDMHAGDEFVFDGVERINPGGKKVWARGNIDSHGHTHWGVWVAKERLVVHNVPLDVKPTYPPIELLREQWFRSWPELFVQGG